MEHREKQMVNSGGPEDVISETNCVEKVILKHFSFLSAPRAFSMKISTVVCAEHVESHLF